MPLVSAVIPVYNGAAFVAQAVRSALHQHHVDLEVVVVDDGSTDATPSILADFGHRIRVIRQPNAGHVNARNHGCRAAQGRWLAFLDADDEWLPDKLHLQLAAAQKSDVGLVYTDCEYFGDTQRVHARQSEGKQLSQGDLFEPLLLDNFLTLSSVMVTKEWFDRLGGFNPDVYFCPDWDFWLRFSAAGGKAALVPEPLTRYRWHASSMTHTAQNQQMACDGRRVTLERALATPRGQSLPNSVAQLALAEMWKCSAWFAAPTQRSLALRWYARAAWHAPTNWSIYREMLKCCLGRA